MSVLSDQLDLDAEILRAILERPVLDEDENYNPHAITDREREVFSSMLDRLEKGFPLSDKQRYWAKSVKERVTQEPEYLNLASSGKLCRGREVSTPEVLRNLPKKPPRKKVEDDG